MAEEILNAALLPSILPHLSLPSLLAISSTSRLLRYYVWEMYLPEEIDFSSLPPITRSKFNNCQLMEILSLPTMGKLLQRTKNINLSCTLITANRFENIIMSLRKLQRITLFRCPLLTEKAFVVALWKLPRRKLDVGFGWDSGYSTVTTFIKTPKGILIDRYPCPLGIHGLPYDPKAQEDCCECRFLRSRACKECINEVSSWSTQAPSCDICIRPTCERHLCETNTQYAASTIFMDRGFVCVECNVSTPCTICTKGQVQSRAGCFWCRAEVCEACWESEMKLKGMYYFCRKCRVVSNVWNAGSLYGSDFVFF